MEVPPELLSFVVEELSAMGVSVVVILISLVSELLKTWVLVTGFITALFSKFKLIPISINIKEKDNNSFDNLILLFDVIRFSYFLFYCSKFTDKKKDYICLYLAKISLYLS